MLFRHWIGATKVNYLVSNHCDLHHNFLQFQYWGETRWTIRRKWAGTRPGWLLIRMKLRTMAFPIHPPLEVPTSDWQSECNSQSGTSRGRDLLEYRYWLWNSRISNSERRLATYHNVILSALRELPKKIGRDKHYSTTVMEPEIP